MVSAVHTNGDLTDRELLALAGAAEQGSSHLLARTLADAAAALGTRLPIARHTTESPGRGVMAEVDGRQVIVGARAFVLERATMPAVQALAALEGNDVGLRAYVAVDGRLAGVVEYADRVRPDLHLLFSELARLGIDRTILLSGDHTPNVRAVAQLAGISETHGDLLPDGKVSIIRQLAREGAHVLMVGDGTNDAPALSAADVGIALASHGGGISAEAADVVILADDLSRVGDAIAIGKRVMAIARESIWLGLSLSAAAMMAAAAGFLVPTLGALLQEVIDIAAITNALRASRA
jgi:P-type E1-E2 ATPase